MKSASEGGLAVVTGAAGGLGSSFANKLAQRGHRVLLVDRREHQLQQVCESISARYGVRTDYCAIDLSKREEVQQLASRLEQAPDMEVLVNNAGFESLDYFVDADPRALVDMVDVHVTTPVMLTRAVLPGMLERNSGAIINVSSLSAWLQSAGNVQYGATKCFLAFFSATLHEELRGSNVRVQALCPGFVRTEFHDAETMRGYTLRSIRTARLWMSADEVAECSLRRLSGKQVVVIPGMGYSIFGRLAQMPLLQPIMRRLTHVPRLAPSPAPTPEISPTTPLGVASALETAAASYAKCQSAEPSRAAG